MKKTVIIGASPNPGRYSFMAAHRLKEYNHEFVPVGIKRGEVLGKSILDIRMQPKIEDVHTITLYVRPERLQPWEDYLLGLKPRRIIFNPGAENILFEKRARAEGIEAIEACTLVMLHTEQF